LLGIGLNQLQAQIISGTMKGDDGQLLIGGTVVVKGSPVGARSDLNGVYEIGASSKDTLVFTYFGFDNLEVAVGNQTQIDVVLTTNVKSLEEVVVIGYGTQRKKEVTGAVVQVGQDVISKTATADLAASLQGQVAGVNVQASSGRPGDGANVQIRGLGSINAGALGPLYVVDGIPFENAPNLAPEQIESVDILKDGASAAIYGTRGSNGVILITTKRGKEGQMQVDFSAYGGIQNITSGTPLMNTQQQVYQEIARQAALGGQTNLLILNPNALDNDSDFVGDVQNNNAGIQNYNLFVAGGVPNLTLSFNTNYFRQNGTLINSGFDRLSNRITGQFTKGRFKAFATVGFTNENRQQEPWALYEYGIAQAPMQRPLATIEDIGQNSVEFDEQISNDILFSFLSRQLDNIDERKVNSSNLALNLEYEIIDGLKFKVNLGRNTYDYKRRFFQPQYLVYDREGNYRPSASRENALLDEDFTSTVRETWENILAYNKQFGKHRIGFTGVISYEQFDSKVFGVGVIYSDDASNDLQTLGSGADGIRPTSNNTRYTLAGKLARVQYNYDDRYLFSASIRRDGSSRFSETNQYGNFPGVSAGWNIHNESFFKVPAVTNFKVRGSWAEVGNQSIPAYAYVPVILTGVNYPFGVNEELNFGNIQRAYVDPNIRWETTVTSNIGIDIGLFENRLTFTADFYNNAKRDMLLQERLTPSSGVYQPRAQGVYDVRITNAGNMVNRGMEFALGYQDLTQKGLRYKFNATFTRNVNEVTDLNGVERGYANGRPVVSRGPNVDYTTFLAEGYEAGAFFLVQHDGVIKTEEELAEYQLIDPSAQLGDMRYIDQNGDSIITDADRVYSGSGIPAFEAGFSVNLSYKNFDFFAQLYGTYGAEIFNGSRYLAYTFGRHLDQYHMWTPQNPDSDIPADRVDGFHNNIRARSDYWLEDGSYLRVRNISIGYTFAVASKIGIEKARIYISSLNPFTFTNYTGYDPEVGGDGLFLRGVDRGNYPVARQVTGGVQLSF
ncbi:MAG: TonB-dependent receptor, partial [Bacteroidota bacterium]